jgi:perosamine synthetase
VGVEPGDEVLVPPWTMSASAAAILMCGAIPVFIDVEASTYQMNPALLEKNISKRTKAIVVVHLFGYPARMQSILHVAKKYQLRVVEDCAQAPGALYQGRPVGTLADVGVYSLNQHKTITTGEGGVAVTHNRLYALRMQLVRNHGEAVTGHLKEAAGEVCLGWNYRITELHAALGANQITKLKRLNQHRVRLARYLIKKMKDLPGLTFSVSDSKTTHVYFTFPISYDAKLVGVSRDVFVKALLAEGIPASAGYVRPLYLEPIYQKERIFKRSRFPFNLRKSNHRSSYRKGLCPVAEDLHYKSFIALDLCAHPLGFKDMDDIVRAFHKIFAQLPALKKSASC